MAGKMCDKTCKCAKIVKTVMQVCDNEKRSGATILSLEKSSLRAAMYTGLSVANCRKFAKMSLNSSRKPKKTRSDKVQLDSFDCDLIRRTVFDMIQRHKEVPTAKAIVRQLKEVMSFPYSLSFLRKTLKELWFIWKRCASNQTVLMERADITVARLQYIRQIKTFREEGRPIIFTDKTYVHSTHSAKKCWPSDKVEIFKSRTSSGDYHSEMSGSNFFRWLKEMLIPNLPPRSIVVVDIAPYHNLQVDKCPTQAATKKTITEWLERKGIVFGPDMLKSELLDVCKRRKSEPRYVLDETLREHGHDCLRLPQYLPELNAIELIWSQVKGKVAQTNMTYKVAGVQQLTRDAIESVTPDDWARCCRHVEDVETQFWKDNGAIERAVDQFIIDVSDEEATDTASECEDYSDTDSALE